MVLVCSFYVNSAGSNLQSLCRNVHLFDMPRSDRYIQQAVGCVRRLGQRRIVKVYDYFLQDSFNNRQLSLNLNKFVPSLVTELNQNIVQVYYDKKTKELDLGHWARNLDDILSPVKEEHIAIVEIFSDRLVQDDDLMYAFIDALKTGTGDILRRQEDWELDLDHWKGQEVMEFIPASAMEE